MKMEKQKSYKSWTISDEFLDAVKSYIPVYKRDPQKEYKRAVGGGRKPPDMRRILEGIFYVLRANPTIGYLCTSMSFRQTIIAKANWINAT